MLINKFNLPHSMETIASPQGISPNQQALVEILSLYQDKNFTRSNSPANYINQVARILKAVEPDIRKGAADEFLKKHVKEATNNLEAKVIFEKVANGDTDLSSLMCLNETSSDIDKPMKYNWDFLDRGQNDILSRLRLLANAMYQQIDIPFMSTNKYAKMVDLAKSALKSYDFKYQSWQEIKDLGAQQSIPATGAEVAATLSFFNRDKFYNLYNSGKTSGMISFARQSIRALLFLKQRFQNEPAFDKAIGQCINQYLTFLPETKRYKSLRNDLAKLTEIYKCG